MLVRLKHGLDWYESASVEVQQRIDVRRMLEGLVLGFSQTLAESAEGIALAKRCLSVVEAPRRRQLWRDLFARAELVVAS